MVQSMAIAAGTGKSRHLLVVPGVAAVEGRAPGSLLHGGRPRETLYRALADNSVGRIIDTLCLRPCARESSPRHPGGDHGVWALWSCQPRSPRFPLSAGSRRGLLHVLDIDGGAVGQDGHRLIVELRLLRVADLDLGHNLRDWTCGWMHDAVQQ
jgi:hypothetical protein